MASSRDRTILIANPGADLYGSDRMVLETVAAMRAAEWRVAVAVPRDGPLIPYLRELGAEVHACPTPVIRKSAMKPLGLAKLLLELVRAIPPAVRLIRRVDPAIVCVSTITAPLWFLVSRALRRPVVCHVHEGEASASRLVLKAINLPLFLAKRLIINSKFSLGVLAGVFPRLARRTVVVYNAVRGPVTPAEPRVDLSPPYRLLYVGRLSPRKGPDVAIRAVSLLLKRGVPAHLDLVGAVFPGYEWFQSELDELVRAEHLEQAVTFHGFQQDTWPFAAAADIVLVPSTVDEPFGNTAVEAALAGRPLVVSSIAGLLEAADGLESAIQVDPSDPEQIATAVEKIVVSWEHFRQAAGRDAGVSATRYSPASYADGVRAVIKEALP